MTVAYKDISTVTDFEGSTVSAPNIADGDLMIVFLAAKGEFGSRTGWTQILSVDGGTAAVRVLAKVADSTDANETNFSFGTFTNSSTCVALMSISGTSFTSADNVTDSVTDTISASSGTNTFTGEVSPNGANSLLIIGSATGDINTINQSSYDTADLTLSGTERADINETSDGDVSLAVYTDTFSASTGSTFSINYSNDPGDAVGFMLAVQETGDGSTTGTTGDIRVVGNLGSPSGSAEVSGVTANVNFLANTGTAEAREDRWNKQDKSGTPSWTPQNKS